MNIIDNVADTWEDFWGYDNTEYRSFAGQVSLSQLGEEIKEAAYEAQLRENMDEYTVGNAASTLIPGVGPGIAVWGVIERDQSAADYDADNRASGMFDDIPELFADFDDGSSREVDVTVGEGDGYATGRGGHGTKTTVEPENSDMAVAEGLEDNLDLSDSLEEIDDRLVTWHGELALQFKDHFKTPLGSVPVNQQQLVAELRSALDGHNELVKTATNAMWELGTATLEQLYKYPEQAPVDLAIGIIDLVVSVISAKRAVKEVKDGSKLVPELVGSAVTIETKAKVVEDLKFSISGETVPEFVESLRSSISTLKDTIETEEDKLATTLEGSIDGLETFLDGNKEGTEPHVRPMPPDVATVESIDLDEFRGA